ncbi:Rieske (2Fe-2S) protein [Rhizomonospora bruguierae]|uniref:Rieske (2Fe-2S) protein n=1 Tax=Rhizomonospora bruguierae TaxID=1581705 RepID=UPI001BCFB7DB|nr:Rieske 2Fe-2S domain-containing protein [Micromonospora sp. NBRC 107566]
MTDADSTPTRSATPEAGGATRRALLTGTGAVGVTALLAACGTDNSAEPGTAPPTGPAQSGTGAPTGGDGAVPVGKAADVKVGSGAIFTATSVVVTQPKEGEFLAFDSTCTHQGCPLTSVADGVINCACHGSKFSIETGEPLKGPATKALAKKKVNVKNGEITLA